MTRAGLRTALALAAALMAAVAPPVPAAAQVGDRPVLEAELRPSDAAPGIRFGTSVAADGDTVVVGVPGDSRRGEHAGSVLVFRRGQGAWPLEAELFAPDARPFDQFGWAVAIAGDAVVVGARFADVAAAQSGSAYVFARRDGRWALQGALAAGDGERDDLFGSDVAVDGGTVVVGAWGDDDGGLDAGSAYVFARRDDVWAQQAKLLAADGQPSALFGDAVAVEGDTVLVGAPLDRGLTPYAGSVSVFTREGDGWAQQDRLVAADGRPFDLFGDSLALSGDTVVVGANLDNEVAPASGSVYVFRRLEGTWHQAGTVVPSDPRPFHFFGEDVDVDGDHVLVGAPLDDDQGRDAGAAYLFGRAGDGWDERAKLLALDGAPGDGFGSSVALGDGMAAVGAPGDDHRGEDAGAGHVFAWGPAPGDDVPDAPWRTGRWVPVLR